MSVSEEPPVSTVPIVVNSVRWEEASNGFVPSGAVCGGKDLDDQPVYIGRTRLRENRNELTPGVLIPSLGHLVVSYGTGVRTSTEYEVLVTSDPVFVHWVPCSNGQVPANAVIGGIDCSYLEPLYIGKTRGNLSLGRTWRGQRFPNGDHHHENGTGNHVLNSHNEDSPSSSPEFSSSSRRAFTRRIVNLDAKQAKRRKNESIAGGEEKQFEVSFPGKVHHTHKCLYIPYNDKEYLFRDYEVLTLTTSPASLSVICKCVLRDHLLTTVTSASSPSDNVIRSQTTLMGDSDNYIEKHLSQKIDALPLPSKLKEFCKQGIE